MSLQHLIEEQKKELEELVFYVDPADRNYVKEKLDTLLTTAITKGYELALENDLQKILTHLAHLKETI